MRKIVHAADLHLDSPLTGLERYPGAPVGELRRATRDALERLVQLCTAEAADLLLIAGDLFDGGWRDYSTGLFFTDQMARLRDAGVKVVWIRGNHDAASRLTRHLMPPDNVRELDYRQPESVAYEELNVVVHGQGFAEAAVETDLSARYPAPVKGTLNVGLLHTALDGREGHAPYAPCTLSGLVDRGYGYWALGHVHAHEVVHRAPFVVYPGNLQGRHARETGPKGAVVVTHEGGRVTGVEHRALDVVRWARVTVDASSSETLDDVGEAVRVALRAESVAAGQRLLAVRVHIAGPSVVHAPLHRDPELAGALVRSAARDAGTGSIWVERVVCQTEALAARDPSATELGPLAELARELAALRGSPEAAAGFLGEVAGVPELLRKLRLLDEDGSGSAASTLDPLSVLADAEAMLRARLGQEAGP